MTPKEEHEALKESLTIELSDYYKQKILKELFLKADRMSESTKTSEECEHMKWVFSYMRHMEEFIKERLD